MAFVGGQTGADKISIGSNPGMLDVPIMDSKRDIGKSSEGMFLLSLARKQGTPCYSTGSMGEDCNPKGVRGLGT